MRSRRSRPGPNIGRGRALIHKIAQPQDGPLRGAGTARRSPHLRTDRDPGRQRPRWWQVRRAAGFARDGRPAPSVPIGLAGPQHALGPGFLPQRGGPVRLPVPHRSAPADSRPPATPPLRLTRSPVYPIVSLPSPTEIGGALVELGPNAEPDGEHTGRGSHHQFLRRAGGLPLQPFKLVRVPRTPGKALTGRRHFLHNLRLAPWRGALLNLGEDLIRDVPVDIEFPSHLSFLSRSVKVDAPSACR